MTSVAELTEFIQKHLRDLPPLPVVVHKLVATLDDDDSSAEDVMKVLSTDQALVGKVLKLVNSSFYGMSGEISTPSQAVVILGFAAIRNLAIGLSVAKFMALSSDDDGEDMRRFWDHSIATAASGKVLAKRTNLIDPEEAFIAGLLHDIGQLVLGLIIPEEYAAIRAHGTVDLVANEQAAIGLGHARAGQMLLKHWKLPKTLTDAVRFHHTPKIACGGDDPLVTIIALADTLANVQGEAYSRAVPDDQLFALIAAAKFNPAEIKEVLTDIETHIVEARFFLEIASDAEFEPAATTAATPTQVVLISPDQTTVDWVTGILAYYDMSLVPMKTFFTNPALENEIDLILLDANHISATQFEKMAPRLTTTEVPLMVYGGDKEEKATRYLDRKLPVLPVAFSRAAVSTEAI